MSQPRLFASRRDEGQRTHDRVHYSYPRRGPHMKRAMKIRTLRRALKRAQSYSAWLRNAHELDTLLELDRWRRSPDSNVYNAKSLAEHISRLKGYRLSGSIGALQEFLPESLYQNLSALNSETLYRGAHAGTKDLVVDYFKEAVEGIDYLADTDNPSWSEQEKLNRFRQAQESFGRTALLLSGGATLGYYHLGVAKALWQEGLLPQVISGSSMGAIIASSICTRANSQLGSWFDEAIFAPGKSLELQGLLDAAKTRSLLDQTVLRESLGRAIPDLTFHESFTVSGRVLNITVSPTRGRQKPRILNHRTAPDVYVIDACLASAAVPGLFKPVTLKKKTRSGRRVDYLASERWSDGSLTGDVPKKRLSRLQNVNHFIVSQTNPHVLPFIHASSGLGPARRLATVTGEFLRGQTKAFLATGRQLVDGSGLESLVKSAESFMTQDYGGDITIHPSFDADLYIRMFSNPSPDVMARFILEGQRSTWPMVEQIRLQTAIGRALNGAIARIIRRQQRP
ncbi:MAG: hypothetical protein CMH52_05975 [Myxococcales bacterium]|nr:hypothetical protein [Myxococcales bacterium]